MIREDQWLSSAVIYAIIVRKFKDSDGDGIGDFRGLTQKLDYLADLGVNCLWILPFYPSPRKDNGYDISDYYSVDDEHGTLGDLVEFIHSAKSKGMRIIIDLVVNHTSDQHPWFLASRTRSSSRYNDFYIWQDEKGPEQPKDKLPFPNDQSGQWLYDRVAKMYYYHTFYDHQPDLNLENERVKEEIKHITGFWAQLGVDGFRIDAAEPMQRQEKFRDDPQDLFREIRSFLEWRHTETALIGEADDSPHDLLEYFDEGEKFHCLFDFITNAFLWHSLATEQVTPLLNAMSIVPPAPKGAGFIQFLRNLDELNLAHLPEAAKEEVKEEFAPKQNMQIWDRGIRRRVAPMLQNQSRIRLAYAVLFSLPGIPCIVYGDELGMGEKLSEEGRDAVRTVMQWNDERHAGFSTAKEIHEPIVQSAEFGKDQINVEQQLRDPNSLFYFMRNLINLRKSHSLIARTKPKIIEQDNKSLFVICYVHQGKQFVGVHNFSSKSQQLHPDAWKIPAKARLLIQSQDHDPTQINAYGYYWYEFKENE